MSDTTLPPDDLAAVRPTRIARLRIDRQERYLHSLNVARSLRIDNQLSLEGIDALVNQGMQELELMRPEGEGYLIGRRRPVKKSKDTPTTCTVFIDECGAHNRLAKEKFEAFVLCAVIVRDNEWEFLDRRWKRWKQDFLGSSRKRVHEPDIRDKNKSFWCGGDRAKTARAIKDLDRIIPKLPFTAIACVIHRERLNAEYGISPFDESLPQNLYLLAIHFLLERVVLALEDHFDGARAHLVVESRGDADDATFQLEVARLFLHGTTYLSREYFRDKLFPGLEFKTKAGNSSGLQIADLMARPCGEKVSEPTSAPGRWGAFRDKLCPGMETRHSIIGFKVVPWDEMYEGIWKS